MAYRVTSDAAQRGRPGAGNRSQSAARRRGDSALARNVILTGLAAGCIALVSAGTALLGRDRQLGSPSSYVASHKAIQAALLEPAQRAVARDIAFAAQAPLAPVRVKTVRIDSIPAAAPIERPQQIAAADAAPPARAFDDMPTGSLGEGVQAGTPPPRHAPLREHESKPPGKPRALTAHEKLYGPVRLASLTPLDGVLDSGGLPRAPYDRQTAVYVIKDKKVYMPDGASLEAHSGLGNKMDDPRFVHVRMHGATPPHVYDMKMREALFHGVEAIRLTPIGGDGAIYGRAGLLAHTYMLGPNGQSNGCVSFKNYDAFLKAFKAGRISRLAVIARLD